MVDEAIWHAKFDFVLRIQRHLSRFSDTVGCLLSGRDVFLDQSVNDDDRSSTIDVHVVVWRDQLAIKRWLNDIMTDTDIDVSQFQRFSQRSSFRDDDPLLASVVDGQYVLTTRSHWRILCGLC